MIINFKKNLKAYPTRKQEDSFFKESSEKQVKNTKISLHKDNKFFSKNQGKFSLR